MAYDAELYAAVHDGAPGDVDFYLRVTEPGQRVLELGAGWGRVAAALAAEGREVIALESDPGMRALASARHPGLDVRDGDMAGFALDARFDRVLVPFTGLYCLESEDAVRRCFRAAREHLVPGGAFIFDAYAADAFHAESRPEDYPDDQLEEVARIEHRGRPLIVYEKSSWDRDAQRMDATYVYVDAETEETVHEGTIAHRYLLAAQVERLLEEAELTLEASFGSFEGAPFGQGGSMIVIATR